MINKLDSSPSLETIFRLSYDLRKNGKVIGFTHGAFDLLHVGHLHLLKEARKQCDVLIVAVENDSNFSKYKGYPGRPIISSANRLEMVNQSSAVSLAFINELPPVSDTYRLLYRELNPHFLAIGRHFGAEDKVLTDVQKTKLKLIRIENDLESTSNIINRITKSVYANLKIS